MAITDTGVPSFSPHYAIKQLILNNLVSPDPSLWTVAVNNDWFEYKLAKTYQIAIYPVYSETNQFSLTGGGSSTSPKISTAYYTVSAIHPDRESAHSLFRNLTTLFNNETLTSPQNINGYAGLAGTDYHWVRITKASVGQMVDLTAPECGPGGSSDDKCEGYRYDITVAIRWNE